MSKTVEVKHNVYTFTWWVKWVSSIIILFAMMIRASQLSPFIDSILSFIGCLGWLIVGLRWRDRAIIILNTVDFPTPLGPSRPQISPSRTFRDTSSKICLLLIPLVFAIFLNNTSK